MKKISQNFSLFALVLFLNIRLFAAPFDPCISIFPTQLEVGEAAAQRIADLIVKNQKEGKPIVLGLATGSTPIPVYIALKNILREKHLDLSQVVTFNLDEYLGLPADHPQSYHSFMFSQLFDELLSYGLKIENIHIPNGSLQTEGDLSKEERSALSKRFPKRTRDRNLTHEEQLWIAGRRTLDYEALIERFGPIDLQILGIGCNGHIGFSEPGTAFSARTMIADLTETTRRDNARFFDGELRAVPEHAITMGIGTILQAREILLLATGAKKAEIIAKTLKEAISNEIPSTALRLHRNVHIFLDEKASSLLKTNRKEPVKRFYNARLLLDHKIQKGELWVAGGKIVPPQREADRSIDVQDALIAPGFIDLQINGGFGCDFSRNPEKVDLVAKRLPEYGVTAFLPTVVSSEPDQYRACLPLLQPRSYGSAGAAILGIHLEGPYFSPSYCAAHDRQLLRPAYDEASSIEKIYGSLEGVRMVTLAPEIPGAMQLIQLLKKNRIVVAAGHSNANFDQMQAGIEAGVEFVTHLFNAMPSFHHRNPGVIGCALIHPSLPYSLIADGVHLCPETISLCWRCNPGGLILVSDSTEALGLPSGKYKLGTREIEVNNEHVYIAGTQTIAGSTLRLDQAVRRLRKITECSIVEALEAVSLKPAQLIHVYPAKGTLEVGADADFLILSNDLNIKASYIGGELYEAPDHL